MMRYEEVAALVLAALLLAPFMYAGWVLVACAFHSPMVVVVPAVKRNVAQTVVVMVGLYGYYLGWMVLHRREPTTPNIVLMVGVAVGVALLTLLLWYWSRSMMAPHAAFDGGLCRPRDLRFAVRAYLVASDKETNNITLEATPNREEIVLRWNDRQRRLRPASPHAVADLLAAVNSLFPSGETLVVTKKKGATAQASYVNSLETIDTTS